MSGDEPRGDGPHAEDAGAEGASRTRLAFALGGAALLAAIVAGVLVAQGSGEEGPTIPTGTCFVAWNENLVAPRQDGIHAYTAHGYRQTLVARVDREGNIVEDADEDVPPDDPETPCAVIFASPQPDFEPDFGVRVLERLPRDQQTEDIEARWTGLSLTEGTKLEDIARLQAEAVATSNAVLRSDGLLTAD